MKKLILIFGLLLMGINGYAQQQTYFNKVLRSDTAIIFQFTSVPLTATSYITAGLSKGYNSDNYFISKIDQHLNASWTLHITSDTIHNFAVLGGQDQLIQSTDNNLIFGHHFGHPTAENDVIAMVAKINLEGKILWRKKLDHADVVDLNGLTPTPDHGCLVWGFQYDDGNYVANTGFLIKLDSLGNTLWENYYNERRGGTITSVHPNQDGTFLVQSHNYADQETYGPNILKVRKNGQTHWERFYTTENTQTFISVVKELPNGNFLLVGDRRVARFNYKLYFAQLDFQGRLLWESIPENVPFRTSIKDVHILNAKGDFLAVGTSREGNGLIVRGNSEGNVLWHKTVYDGDLPLDPVDSYFADMDILPNTNDSLLLLTGYRIGDANSPPFQQTGWLVAIDLEGNTCQAINCDSIAGIVSSISPTRSPKATLLTTYPNPATHTLYVTLSSLPTPKQNHQLILRDLQGRLVHQQTLSPTSTIDIAIPTRQLPAGMYLLSVEQKGIVLEQQKVVITH